MKSGLLEQIKSRGYWRINFRPTVLGDKLKTMQQCKEIIEKNALRLRGWDYPHIPRRNDDQGGSEPAGKYYEEWTDWWNHKEFWQMYKSGQFLHYVALREDWLESDGMQSELAKTIKPLQKLGVTGSVIFQMTEIFQFLVRLIREGIYEEGVIVSISLYNLKGRELWIEDPMKMGFFYPRKTGAPELTFERTLTKDEAVTKANELALDAALFIFDHFEWNPEIATIKADQDKLLSGRF